MKRIFNSLDCMAEEFRPNYREELQEEKRRQAAQKILSNAMPIKGHLYIDSHFDAYSDAAK